MIKLDRCRTFIDAIKALALFQKERDSLQVNLEEEPPAVAKVTYFLEMV